MRHCALHDSGLVKYANEDLGIELYAIISGDDSSILSISTNFNTGRVYPEEDVNFNAGRGDSVLDNI